jgi:hypothetical protein
MSGNGLTGDTFADRSAGIRRMEDITYRVARLNADGWRTNQAGEFYWRLVTAVRADDLNGSDQFIARTMIERAIAVLKDRLDSLEPKDGLERIEPTLEQCRASAAADAAGRPGRRTAVLSKPDSPPPDLRTTAGRRWKREHAGAAT